MCVSSGSRDGIDIGTLAKAGNVAGIDDTEPAT